MKLPILAGRQMNKGANVLDFGESVINSHTGLNEVGGGGCRGAANAQPTMHIDLPALLNYRRQAPGAAQAHPTDEHLLPLYVALGAAGDPADIQRFHAGIDDYVLAMDAYAFLPEAGN